VAAGKAIGGIAEHVPQWNPNGNNSMQDVKQEPAPDPMEHNCDVKIETDDPPAARFGNGVDDSRLSFDTFDPMRVLRNGEKLLGSAGKVRFLNT